MRFKRVGVLMGGISAEREISLQSGEAVADGLGETGYEVIRIDATRELDMQLRAAQVEAVFIALHGRWGEDGTVQGMLEIMGIPYTGSGPLASALAMDKSRTRDILASAGLNVAPGIVVTDADPTPEGGLSFPLVVKPVNEGSSVGVTIVREKSDLEASIRKALSCSRRALLEKYVPGAEVQVAVIDGEVLGSVEIEPHREFYDYGAKYKQGGSTHHIPPRLDRDTIDRACDLGARAFVAVGCAGAARIDLILPREDQPVILEVNTIPGMTPTSLLPEIAAHRGISFPDLVSRMMEGARLHVG